MFCGADCRGSAIICFACARHPASSGSTSGSSSASALCYFILWYHAYTGIIINRRSGITSHTSHGHKTGTRSMQPVHIPVYCYKLTTAVVPCHLFSTNLLPCLVRCFSVFWPFKHKTPESQCITDIDWAYRWTALCLEAQVNAALYQANSRLYFAIRRLGSMPYWFRLGN